MGILPATDATFDATAPVLVIGAGACGLTAALAARERGAAVVVLERDATPGGSTALSTALIPAAGTRLQRAAGIDDSAEIFAADIVGKAKGETDAAMAAVVARASAPTIEWLIDAEGVPFELETGFVYPGHSRLRMHGTPNRSGRELEDALLAAAGRRGIDIMTGALVTDLFADADGRVTGAALRRPDGTVEMIGCDALVLACNGYGGNPELVARYLPEMADALYFGHAGNRGDAVAWGLALGAAVADMGAYQGHGGVAHPHDVLITWGVIAEGGFQVNAEGRRFANEMRGYSEQALEVVEQPGHVAWDIYDSRCEQAVLGFADYRDAIEMGAIKQADTIAALAQTTALPEAALARSLDEVRQMAAGARPDPLGRDFTAKPALAPPYRAVRVTGALFHTQGGLVVDDRARVLNTDGSALPNLFAGGGAARGLSGPSCWGYLSGNGLLTAITLGRAAGESAASLAFGRPI